MRDVRWGLAAYSAFFHREPDSVLTANLVDGAEIFVARYPPIKGGFLKKMFAAMPNYTVWITSGMSLREQSVPAGSKADRRIELSAYVPDSAWFGGSDGQDLIAELLRILAVYPFTENTWLGPGQTFSFPEPLLAGSDMNGVFFGVLDVDLPRLCRCTPGQASVVSSIIPITSAEGDWYRSHNDMMALLDLFEEKGVGTHFDPRRASAV